MHADFEWNIVARELKNALDDFRREDGADLQEYDFSERVITHRLAKFLSGYFEKKPFELRVDCEYNRNITAPKRIIGASSEKIRDLVLKAASKVSSSVDIYELASMLLREERLSVPVHRLEQFITAAQHWREAAGHLINPDIIVHHRGTHEHNLLVVEAKKAPENEAAEQYDYVKLEYFTTREAAKNAKEAKSGLNYRYGVFLRFDNTGAVEFASRFDNGEFHSDVLVDFKA